MEKICSVMPPTAIVIPSITRKMELCVTCDLINQAPTCVIAVAGKVKRCIEIRDGSIHDGKVLYNLAICCDFKTLGAIPVRIA